MNENCGNCKFWQAESAIQFKDDRGCVAPCRRYPPGPLLEHYNAPILTPVQTVGTLLPMTKSVNWCGEWKQVLDQKLVEKLQAAGYENLNDVFNNFTESGVNGCAELTVRDWNALKAMMKSLSIK